MRYFRNMTFLVFLLSLFLSMTVFAAEERSLSVRKKTSSTERRVALIIGNSSYSDAPLKNPVNDADAMARVLRETGFDVTVIKNADRRKMYSSMNEFGRKLKKSDVGLFYYAGHGVQIDSNNYLLPTDLKGNDIQETDDLRQNSFSLNELLDRMRDASTDNIIILDACRDNPFLTRMSRSASRGLAKVSTPASTSILYSTDPGNTASDGVSGDNGVFTNRLVESIQKRGLELVEVMREVALNVSRDTNGAQRPIFDGVLSSKFYFREPEVTKQTDPQQVITVDRQVMDLRYWESAEKSATAAAYQSYLKKFPTGDFAELAKERMEHIAAQKSEKADLQHSAKEAVDPTRLVEERAAIDRVNAQLSSKTQTVASPPSDKALKKETVKERTSTFLVSDLTFTDENSGLTWKRSTDGMKDYGNSLSVVDRANRKMYAGFDDWRLQGESDCRALSSALKSEAQKNNTTILSVINKLYSNYTDWSAWVFGSFGGNQALWGMTCDISVGMLNNTNKNDDALVLLVRGAANQGHLADQKAQPSIKTQAVTSPPSDKVLKNETAKERTGTFLISDLTFTDENSGLTWKRSTDGMKDYGNSLSAVERANRKMYAGYDDWRLQGESDCRTLSSALKSEAQKNNTTILSVINTLYSNYTDWSAWVFGSFGGNQALAGMTCDISVGILHNTNKNDDALVLLVRGAVK